MSNRAPQRPMKGQMVYDSNAIAYGVTKVGRKYFYIRNPRGYEQRVNLRNWRLVSNDKQVQFHADQKAVEADLR